MADNAIRCTECGHINSAERLDGELEPVGIEECPDCGGSEFVEVVQGMASAEPPEQPQPSGEDDPSPSL